MNRAVDLWERYWGDRAVRWPGVVALAALWFAIAFADGRFLLVIPLLGAVVAGVFYVRSRGEPSQAPPEDDWF